MIYLKRNQTNDVVLTLAEKNTITGSTFYLFSFVNDNTNVEKLFTAPDISDSTTKYNEFNIVITGGTEDLTTGIIDLETNGFYKYTCYSMTGSTNLDVSGTTEVVETGKMLLSGTTLPVVTAYTGQSNIKIVYNG